MVLLFPCSMVILESYGPEKLIFEKLYRHRYFYGHVLFPEEEGGKATL